MSETVMNREKLALKPVKHLHFTSYADWRDEVRRRGHIVAPSNHDQPFPFDIALSGTGSGRLVGACFIRGIDFGWLRD